MKNPTPEQRNTRTFALLIIITLIMTILMRGVNTRFDVPHFLYIAVAVICGLVGLISYLGYIYTKMFKAVASSTITDMIKIIILGVMVYFTVTFVIGVISEL